MKDITVHELLKEKERLEIKIIDSLTSLINDFKAQTGYSPNSIYISLVETTPFDRPIKEYRMGNVKVELALERR